MESFFTRYRNPAILAIVLMAQVLGLAVQVKRPVDPNNPDAGSVRLLRSWVIGAMAPVQKVLVSTGGFFRRTWHDYINVVGLRTENRELREQNEKMRLELARQSDTANQAQRLRALLDFKQAYIGSTVAAQVIGSSGSDQSRVLYIDKGSRHGIRPNMAVITPHGIVGKVRDVYRFSSQVLAVNDSSSGVGAILENSRLHGVLKGTSKGEVELAHIMANEVVEPGEKLVTSGGDRIFPKGLLIGSVLHVSPGRDLFLDIRVKPAANLARLEEVLVITEVQGATQEAVEGETPLRASDILAQRLPGVPKKPDPPPVKPKPRATAPPVQAGTHAQPAPGGAQPPVNAGGTAAAGSTSPAPAPANVTPKTNGAAAAPLQPNTSPRPTNGAPKANGTGQTLAAPKPDAAAPPATPPVNQQPPKPATPEGAQR
jgi:rod shape-determining protein MreC